MKTYYITYTKSEATTVVSATNKKEAARLANFQKRLNGYKGRCEISAK